MPRQVIQTHHQTSGNLIHSREELLSPGMNLVLSIVIFTKMTKLRKFFFQDGPSPLIHGCPSCLGSYLQDLWQRFYNMRKLGVSRMVLTARVSGLR